MRFVFVFNYAFILSFQFFFFRFFLLIFLSHHRFRPLIQIVASTQWSIIHLAMDTRKSPISKSNRAAATFVSAAIWISSVEVHTNSRLSQPTEVSVPESAARLTCRMPFMVNDE